MAATWVQIQYYSAYHGNSKLDRQRALDYVKAIKAACFLNDLDQERYFAQVAWESSFVNGIRDRKLAFHSWSYGLSGIQIETAFRLIHSRITGRDLIMDFELNLILGARQMRHLIDKAGGDLHKAEMAYNAGWNGMIRGGGKTYPSSLDATERKWEKFKKEYSVPML